jgi:hypothetical protein
LESNLASIDDVKFNNTTEQVMELRAGSVSQIKIEDIISDMRILKTYFMSFLEILYQIGMKLISLN